MDFNVIRVLIVDDRASARVALRLRLAREPDIDVVGEADGAQDAIFEARISKPDVILLDAQVSENTEVEPMGRLLQETPTAKVIVLSRDDDPTYVQRAFAAGASGFASQAAVEAEIVAAVREVAGGGRYVSQTLGAGCQSARAKCSASSHSVTRTRRSPSSSTSRCAPWSRTGRASCRSSR